jgi:cold shock CspA family protein
MNPGFGFIKDESTRVLQDNSGLTEWSKKDVVSFDLIEGRKGLNAVNVRKA